MNDLCLKFLVNVKYKNVTCENVRKAKKNKNTHEEIFKR